MFEFEYLEIRQKLGNEKFGDKVQQKIRQWQSNLEIKKYMNFFNKIHDAMIYKHDSHTIQWKMPIGIIIMLYNKCFNYSKTKFNK